MDKGTRKNLLTDGAWVAFGQASSALGALASVRILTEVLTPGTFGSLSLFMGVVLLSQGMVSTPLIQAMLRLHPDHAKQNDVGRLYQAVGKMLGVRTLGMALVLLVAGLVARIHFGFSVEMIMLVAGLLGSETWRAYRINFFNAERRQKEFAVWLAADAWLKPLAAWLMVLTLNATAESVFLGYVLASAAVTLALYLRERGMPTSNAIAHTENDIQIRRAIHRYSLPLVPLALVGWFNGMVDRYMIGGTLGLEQAGLYVAAYGLVSRPFLMVGLVVEQTFRQAYYQATSHGESQLAARLFRQWLTLVATVCLVGLVLFMSLQEPLARVFLGAEFREAAFLMPWIAAAYSLLAISQVFERKLYAKHDTIKVLTIQLVGGVVLTIFLNCFLEKFGIQGAGWSLFCALATQLTTSLFLSYKGNGK